MTSNVQNPASAPRHLFEFWLTVALCSAFSLYIPQLAPLRYLFIAIFVVIIFLNYQMVLGLVSRVWPIFLLPALMILSILWSPSPEPWERRPPPGSSQAFAYRWGSPRPRPSPVEARRRPYGPFG